MKTLFLVVKRLPFNAMQSGEKKFEFRKPSKFIFSRLFNPDGTLKHYDTVTLQIGYMKNAARVVCEYNGFYFAGEESRATYSNGLIVDVEKFDIVIKLGEIIPHRT